MNIDSELYSQIDVNLGSTDVDSPTTAAGGGTINFVTKKPADTFGVEAQETIGDYAFRREFFRVDTGKFGPWGTSAFLTYSNLYSDQWRGEGKVKRKQWKVVSTGRLTIATSFLCTSCITTAEMPTAM